MLATNRQANYRCRAPIIASTRQFSDALIKSKVKIGFIGRLYATPILYKRLRQTHIVHHAHASLRALFYCVLLRGGGKFQYWNLQFRFPLLNRCRCNKSRIVVVIHVSPPPRFCYFCEILLCVARTSRRLPTRSFGFL